ncbi:MAG: HAMP domain-containing histidine kinase [Phycisphaerales bacterium]|nr:MAG: HAMP domain-containing histidine kinase [Phycisphaerales bacterium]
MKTKGKIGAGYKQLRWVVLLLAIAVVLPTVCLLWFMAQVVNNERLAIRQKLITVYREQLAQTVQQTNERWARKCKLLESQESGRHPYQRLVSTVGDNGCDGLIIYDATGNRTYPLLSVDGTSSIEASERFPKAWEMEFLDGRFPEAIAEYEQSMEYADDGTRLAGLIGKSRCQAKLGKTGEAIETCRQVAFSPLEQEADAAMLVLIANARLLMLKFTEGDTEYDELVQQTFSKLISMVYSANEAGFALPADQNLFVAQKIVEIGKKTSLFDADTGPAYRRMQKLIAAEERSIRLAEQFPTAAAVEGWPTDKLQRLLSGQELIHGLYHKSDGEGLLALVSGEDVASTLAAYHEDFGDSYVACRVLDDAGSFISGLAEPEGEPFAAASVGEYFPGWSIELHFKGGDVFEEAAREQIAVYTWTGMLVIMLILVAGAIAGRAVSKQMKLNKLKNDFIATVSHELKTPLASMRVLVDTVLEGHYRDQQQVTEYLQLVSSENERLTRLIDNFLTFSRMERNKQAFQMTRTDPAAIVRAAAEAVRTKLATGTCNFQVQTGEDLPDIMADRDAMVTVLVNLLDNAYKYSDEDKRIELKVFAENKSVCFSVSDNGIGMSRRAVKKIFGRFYQVDRSLARRAEGCGLGLSIAKFIVDSHKGSISVSSKPGEGSTFVVRLPVANHTG